jgi:hypothetical protein
VLQLVPQVLIQQARNATSSSKPASTPSSPKERRRSKRPWTGNGKRSQARRKSRGQTSGGLLDVGHALGSSLWHGCSMYLSRFGRRRGRLDGSRLRARTRMPSRGSCTCWCSRASRLYFVCHRCRAPVREHVPALPALVCAQDARATAFRSCGPSKYVPTDKAPSDEESLAAITFLQRVSLPSLLSPPPCVR